MSAPGVTKSHWVNPFQIFGISDINGKYQQYNRINKDTENIEAFGGN